jgi:hypothetical protein
MANGNEFRPGLGGGKEPKVGDPKGLRRWG